MADELDGESVWRIPDPRLVLAVEQARASLDRQAREFDDIRARAVTLLSVGALALGLMREMVVAESGHITGWGWPALASLGGLLVGSIYIARPRDWAKPASPAGLHSLITRDPAPTLDEMLRSLLDDAVRDYEQNQDRLRPVGYVLMGMVVALGFAVATLIVAAIAR